MRVTQIRYRLEKIRKKRLEMVCFAAIRSNSIFSANCNHATLMLSHHRLSTTIKHLQLHAREQKRRNAAICRIQQMWQTRYLRQIWLTGWLKLHRKRLAFNNSDAVVKMRYLRRWRQFQELRERHHIEEKRADLLQWKLGCSKIFATWKRYVMWRTTHAQRLLQAQEHYHMQLLQRGVVGLQRTVYQHAQSYSQIRHMRQFVRTSLERRYFREWQHWTQSRQKVWKHLHHLHQSRGYQKSTCHSSRRIWARWVHFVSMRRQCRHSDRHFQQRRKRQVLFAWHRQAQLESNVRRLDRRKRRRMSETLFGLWRSRVGKWKKVGAIRELAKRVYERKLCTRIIRMWRSWSTYYRRVRQCGEFLRHRRKTKLQAIWLHEWQRGFHVSQRYASFRRCREHQIVRNIFVKWSRHSVKQRALARKLIHFEKIYGKCPASSIVARAWRIWQRVCSQNRSMRILRRKLQLKQVRRCWLKWQLLHFSCYVFLSWRHIAHTIASGNNRLGWRLRCFRAAQCQRFQRCAMKEWKNLILRLRHVQETQSLWKHKVNRDLEMETRKAELAARYRLSTLFGRWCMAHNFSSNLAASHFCTRLLERIVRSWWKATIHSKQEKVLVEARQIIGKLSYYQPQQQDQTTRTDSEEKLKLQKTRTKGKSQETTNARVKSMQTMFDPMDCTTYSRCYQESGKESLSTSVPHATDLVNHKTSKLQAGRRRHKDERIHQKDHESSSDHRIGEQSSAIVADRKVSDVQPLDGSSKAALCKSLPISHASDKAQKFRFEVGTQHSLRLPFGDTMPSSNANVRGNVLPLFDTDSAIIEDLAQENAAQQRELGVSAEQSIDHGPDHPSVENVKHALCVYERNSSASSTSTSKVALIEDRTPHSLRTIKPRVQERRTSKDMQSLLPESYGDGGRNHRSRVQKKRSGTLKKRLKVVDTSSNDAASLADILKLNNGLDHGYEAVCDASATQQGTDDVVCDEEMLREIIGYYVDPILLNASETRPSERLEAARILACFHLVRDLALFQNDFYIDELQNVFDSNFVDKFSNAVVEKHEEQARMETFLEQVVEIHPAYCTYVRRLRQDRRSSQLSALRWLARKHLRSLLSRRKGARKCPSQSKMYWIWEPLPAHMDAAFETLLPTIRKYVRVLGQFFLRQAIQSCLKSDQPQNYRIGRAAFISLMKQVCVFPQLFHRRELENVVHLSCCSSPETEELNFPEFIEALVRCSCNLRWGELDEAKHASEGSTRDTVIVIKFVMLIFAMEGQGSVLKKRSEDVGAILGFLGQHEKRNKAEKMLRFRKMLQENKRQTFVAKNPQLSSVWNRVRLQFSPRKPSSLSLLRSQDTLAESWDGQSPYREPDVFDARTNQPYDRDLISSPTCAAEVADCGSDRYTEVTNRDHESLLPFPSQDLVSTSVENVANSTRDALARTFDSSKQNLTSTASTERKTDSAFPCRQEEEIDSAAQTNDVSLRGNAVSDQVYPVASSFLSDGLIMPMEKDAFLQEILTSIGDVELILDQAKFTGTRRQSSKLASKSTAGRAFHSDLAGSFLSVADLAAGIDSHNYDDIQYQSIFSCSKPVNAEVEVRDPMLNYLTDSERFTESTDNTSLIAITNMAARPFLQDPMTQDHLSESNICTPQDIRPVETINAASHTSN